MFSTIRAYLAMFFAQKGYLGRILGLLGMLLCFDLAQCPKFGLVFFIEVVASIVNLMLGF